jgi:hypothetical protein
VIKKPDFSGEYVLNRPACRLSAGASGVDGAVLRFEHRDPTLRTSATFTADGKTLMDYSIELVTDGSEVQVGEHEVCRLYWDGEGLVSEFRGGAGPSQFSMSWRYELVDSGRRVRAVERIRGDGRDQDNIWEFDRR